MMPLRYLLREDLILDRASVLHVNRDTWDLVNVDLPMIGTMTIVIP